MSTCDPDVASIVGEAYDAVGRHFVDCPVSRKAPNMTVLVGGAPGVLGPDEEVLACVSRTLVYCGRRGAGYATKLLNQHVKYSWYLASAEALLIAEAMGLDPGEVATAIAECSGGDSGLSTAAEYFRHDPGVIRDHAPASTIEKDSVLAEKMVTATGISSRSLAVVVDFFRAVGATDFRPCLPRERRTSAASALDGTYASTLMQGPAFSRLCRFLVRRNFTGLAFLFRLLPACLQASASMTPRGDPRPLQSSEGSSWLARI